MTVKFSAGALSGTHKIMQRPPCHVGKWRYIWSECQSGWGRGSALATSTHADSEVLLLTTSQGMLGSLGTSHSYTKNTPMRTNPIIRVTRVWGSVHL